MRGKADNSNPATCQSCHGTKPHPAKMAKLNEHTDKIACQTCHIPEFARGQATKMTWDWSTAGKLTPMASRSRPRIAPAATPTTARRATSPGKTNVIPEYVWFNGKVNYTLRETKLDPSKVVKINSFEGSPDRRQVDDLADQGVPRQAALRHGQQHVAGPAHLRRRRRSPTGRTSTGTRRWKPA